MVKTLALFLLLTIQLGLQGQTTSIFHLETEYTVQFGYRYYFDKLDPATGNSLRINQLPIDGYFTGYAFFNCFGNYVFQGIDSVLSNGQYINKLYEIDTMGNVVRSLAMDTANGTWYKTTLPSAGSPFYYGLRWNIISSQWNLEKINAVTGARTVLILPSLSNYNYWNSDAAITRNDVLWFGMDDQSIGTSILVSVDPASGQVILHDTLNQGNNYYYDCLNYDCNTDSIYGFIAHQDSVNGSELLKIAPANNTVIHTGITAIGSGVFSAGVHTRLATGAFYVRTTNAAYELQNFYAAGPLFVLQSAPTPTTLSTFCYASPRETCTFYTTCEETAVSDFNDHTNSILVFPCPVTSGNISIQTNGVFNVQLVDLSGRVLHSAVSSNTLEINTENYPAGQYLLRVTNETETCYKKIIIAK